MYLLSQHALIAFATLIACESKTNALLQHARSEKLHATAIVFDNFKIFPLHQRHQISIQITGCMFHVEHLSIDLLQCVQLRAVS
jgi:hypothetical protein